MIDFGTRRIHSCTILSQQNNNGDGEQDSDTRKDMTMVTEVVHIVDY
jgi:hypothetical protein